MVYIGGAQIGAAILAGLVGATGVPVIGKVLLLIGTAAINAGVLALSYRWLRTSQARRGAAWRPGRSSAVCCSLVLQLVGVTIVGRADHQCVARVRHLRVGDRAAVLAQPALDHLPRRRRVERGAHGRRTTAVRPIATTPTA